MSVNKVILVGRVGRDPEVRAFENSVKKASFSLATSEYYRDKDGNRNETTDWHSIYCWRKLAEFAEQYVTKGKLIYVEGKLKTRSWEDNGVKKYATEVEANTITLLSSKDDGNKAVNKVENGAELPQAPISVEEASNGADDLPF